MKTPWKAIGYSHNLNTNRRGALLFIEDGTCKLSSEIVQEFNEILQRSTFVEITFSDSSVISTGWLRFFSSKKKVTLETNNAIDYQLKLNGIHPDV